MIHVGDFNMESTIICWNCGEQMVWDKENKLWICPKCGELLMNEMRTFETGATRDTDENKPDLEGFLSPIVIQRFGEYMSKHRIQSDGSLRDSDNWQKGIPKEAYMKSAFRHFMDVWLFHRGYKGRDDMEEALMALMFNIMGYAHELLKEKK